VTPPAELVRELKAYDPELRVRWGVHQRLWIVERQMPPRHKQLLAERPNPWQSPKGLDLWDGWKEGYVHVLSVHPDLIRNTPLVMGEVAKGDMWRAGGQAAVNRRLDDLAAQEEREADRAVAHYTEAAAKETYDDLAWATGRRVAMSTPDPLAAMEDRGGYRVSDRRVGR
jgi:hypothetical protein